MTRTLFAFLALSAFIAIPALLDSEEPHQLGSGNRVPAYPPGVAPVDNVPTLAPGVATTAPRKVRAASVRPAATGSTWDALAECECHGNWACNTGNGYSGGLQMDADFWLAYGGHEFAPEPWMASREQQIVVAERGRTKRGFYPWPTCARKLGLIP